MTLSDALKSIVSSTTKDAVKRPAMGGYFFRGAVSTGTDTAGDFTLTLRKRADDNGSPVDFVYSYDASEKAWTAPATKPELDGELLGELLGDDWTTGTSADFERARTGGEGDEW